LLYRIRSEQEYCLDRGYKLFIDENGFEVVRIDHGIASTPSFKIDIPLYSESIWFGVKKTWIEQNYSRFL